MAEGVNVRFAGELQRFIQSRTGDDGLYSSASEYIRDLVRRDYEREKEEQSKWDALATHLKPGLEADESKFSTLNAEQVIAAARSRKKKHAH